jgi:hypothetical protein
VPLARTCPIRMSLADRWAHPISEPGFVIRTCPFSLLVCFLYLSVFATCPFSPLQNLYDPAASPAAAMRVLGPARPLSPADHTSVAPCLIAASHSKSVNFRNRLLLLLPPTIATCPRSLPASRRRAQGASFSRCETPSFLHYTAVVIPFNPSFNEL